jgi:predicted helicase
MNVSPAKQARNHAALFQLLSNGLQTKRDEWNFDFNRNTLVKKANLLVSAYEEARRDPNNESKSAIKWDADLDRHRRNGIPKAFEDSYVQEVMFRPFVPKWAFLDPHFNSRMFQLRSMFRVGETNPTLSFLSIGSENELAALAVDRPFDLGMMKKGNGGTNQGVGRYRYNKEGNRVDNVTDWALKQFEDRYGKAPSITKDGIFAYVYAVLNDPVYRETYARNLKRDIPRIPLYPDFQRWRDWGQALLDLHIGYEAARPTPLIRTDTPDPKRAEGASPAVKLKSDPDNGIIVLDADTQLSGVPPRAWDYRLGNRSAIDWVLDQHKEKTPRDPTIREKFNTYRFADYKESVIDLLGRVVTVSLATVDIIEAMDALPPEAREGPQ